MASAKIEIDSYQIFVRDDLGEVVWAKIIERIELVLESEDFLVYQIAGLKEKFTSEFHMLLSLIKLLWNFAKLKLMNFKSLLQIIQLKFIR